MARAAKADFARDGRFWLQAHLLWTTGAGLTLKEFTSRVSAKAARGTVRLASNCGVVSLVQRRHTFCTI